MIAGALRRTTSLGMWGSICALFSLFLGAGNLLLSATILVLILLYIAVLIGPHLIVTLWLIGSPTVFGFANQILKALPFFTVERLMFIILMAMLFLRVVFLNRQIPKLDRLEILIILFLGYALLSLVVTASSETWRLDLWFFMQYAIPMTMFIISRRIAWSEQGIKILLACLCLTGVALAAMGLMQTLFGVTLFNVKSVTQGHVDRAYGTFSNAHTYIATLVIFLVLTVFQFNVYRDALARTALLAAMLAMVVGIVLGETRAPWGGAAVTLLIIFVRDREIRPLLMIGGALAAVAGTVLFVMMLDQLGSFVDRVTNLNTLAGRLAVWATAINMIAHNPLFGVGFGADAFVLNKAQYITGIGPLTAQYAVYLEVPHNEYLHVGVLLGLVGLAAFLAILYGVVQRSIATHADSSASPTRRRLALYVVAIISGLMFNSLLSDTHVQDYFWVLAYFLAGAAAGMHEDRETAESKDSGRRGESPA